MSCWALFVSLLASAGVVRAAPTTDGDAAIACDQIPPPELPGVDIISFSAKRELNVSGLFVNESVPKIDLATGLNICNVELSLTHPGVGNKVGFQIWLPLEGWNKRFMATGGGGYVAGSLGTPGLAAPIMQGFAAGVTDGGNISDANGYLSPNMIRSPGEIDIGRFADFSSRALHELALVGKAVTESFYRTPPEYSYWNGCSTGGRQGYMLAQKYPDDFDGILANAPALYFPSLLVALGWGQFTMRRLKHEVPACIFSAFYKASVKACDGLDGVIDDVISNPRACKFDPYSLVGRKVNCSAAISRKDAEVVANIMKGPVSPLGTQLWEKWHWGMNYTLLSPTDPNFANLWDRWTKIMIKKDFTFNINGYNSLSQVADFFVISQAEYDGLIGTNNPDLTAFRSRGGKLLTWHGMSDEVIPMDNTLRYRKQVEAVMGGGALVDEFYRVFLVPGVGHCYGGNGAFPKDALNSLMSWVEDGKAPDRLHGKTNDWNGKPAERIMCAYPLVAKYDGKGDASRASSYTCSKDYAPAVKG